MNTLKQLFFSCIYLLCSLRVHTSVDICWTCWGSLNMNEALHMSKNWCTQHVVLEADETLNTKMSVCCQICTMEVKLLQFRAWPFCLVTQKGNGSSYVQSKFVHLSKVELQLIFSSVQPRFFAVYGVTQLKTSIVHNMDASPYMKGDIWASVTSTSHVFKNMTALANHTHTGGNRNAEQKEIAIKIKANSPKGSQNSVLKLHQCITLNLWKWPRPQIKFNAIWCKGLAMISGFRINNGFSISRHCGVYWAVTFMP